MDEIIIAILAVLAAGYLFWRFRGAVKRKNAACGCGTCGCECGNVLSDCGSDEKNANP